MLSAYYRVSVYHSTTPPFAAAFSLDHPVSYGRIAPQFIVLGATDILSNFSKLVWRWFHPVTNKSALLVALFHRLSMIW